MPTDQPKRSVWPTIFAGAVLLAVAYGGAYSLFVEERCIDSPVPPALVAHYPRNWMERLFAPAHWVDRYLLRPSHWGLPP